jgi:long-chain acyl-CoA synthetase
MSLAAAENARLKPAEVALADDRIALTWVDLDATLNRAINGLLGRPARSAGRIAVFAPNSVEGVLAYLAALHAGVSSVPVNFHFTADEVAYILEDSGADVIFVGPETAEVGKAAAAKAGVATVIGWRCADIDGLTHWDEWLAAAQTHEPPTDMAPRPHLHYTSGTTGRPKGAETPPTMFPAGATVAEVIGKLQQQVAGLGDRSPGMVVSPLYHTGPLGSVRLLAGGISLVVQSRFDPEQVLRAIEQFRVRSTLMVPTHFQRLLSLPEEVRRRYDVSSLVAVSHTGAACPRDVKRQMIDWFGPVLIEAYGATEAGTTNMITSQEWLQKPGSVGKTLPPFELIVVADDGQHLGVNEVGQLYFRDTTGRGIVYHNDPEKTRAAHIEPGVFTLGEVGYFDEDDYVFITDRVSDMIVSGGVNIYPAETEQALLQHPDIADVAVIGAPNAEMGEEVKALVVLRDPARRPSDEELDRFCRERLAGFKCPRSYEFLSDIGRNAMGKVNKRELRRPYWPTERTIG